MLLAQVKAWSNKANNKSLSYIMALPGHRRTSSHKRRRASHFALKKQNLVVCPKCNESILPHRACASCGTYAGRQVISLKSPLAKSKKEEKKAKDKIKKKLENKVKDKLKDLFKF